MTRFARHRLLLAVVALTATSCMADSRETGSAAQRSPEASTEASGGPSPLAPAGEEGNKVSGSGDLLPFCSDLPASDDGVTHEDLSEWASRTEEEIPLGQEIEGNFPNRVGTDDDVGRVSLGFEEEVEDDLRRAAFERLPEDMRDRVCIDPEFGKVQDL